MQQSTPRFDVRDYFRIARKRKWFIILVGLAAMLIGGLYAVSYPKSYRATSLILVRQRPEGVVWLTAPHPGMENGSIALETQASIIMGGELADKVAASLAEKRSGERILADAAEVQAALRAKPLPPDRIRIDAQSPFERRAILFAQEAAEQFLIFNTDFKRAQDTRAREYLEKQLTQTETQLDELQGELMEFQNRMGVYSEDAGADVMVRAMNEYRTAKMNAVADLAATESQLRTIDQMLSSARAGQKSKQWIPNPTTTVLRRQLVSSEVALAELRTRYQDAHPAVQELESRVSSLNSEIEAAPETIEVPYRDIGAGTPVLAKQRDALIGLGADLSARVKALEAIETNLQREAKTIPAKQAMLYRLRARGQLLEKTHARVLEQLEGKRLAEEAKGGSAYILDRATRATSTSPSISRGLLFAGFLGLVAGIALALVLEALDDTIHTPDDITREFDLPFIGMVPLLETGAEELITMSAPKSPPAEAYRTLRSNINFSLLESPAKLFLVTSAGSGEGKTVTATNLAVVFAQAGQSVIIIDTDLRRPALHRMLHGDSSRGLTNVLVGEAAISDILQETSVEGLRFISSGPLPPNPAEMLDSAPMERFINEVGDHADVVIFDSPPAIVLTDAVVLSSKIERTILVAESGQVTREAFNEAIRLVRNARGNLLGVILNKLRLSASDYYYYYYYYDYSHETPRVTPPPNQEA